MMKRTESGRMAISTVCIFLAGCAAPFVKSQNWQKINLTNGEVRAFNTAMQVAKNTSKIGQISCYDFSLERSADKIQINFSSKVEVLNGAIVEICGESTSIIFDSSGKEILSFPIR